MMKKTAIALLVASTSFNVLADETTALDEIKVNAIRGEMDQFSSPASIDVVEGEDVRKKSGMNISLSEALQGIAGVTAVERHNYAQDINLSTRGSRASVRGVRLYVDGIPATMPDGQGVTTHIDMNSLGKIEVLKGPFSSLYGNSSAGAILIQTQRGQNPASIETIVDGGSNGTWHYGLKAQGGGDGKYVPDYVLSVNRFTTKGERDHSAARQNQVNLKTNWTMKNGAEFGFTFNHNHIKAQDPGSLSYAQWKENRDQVASNISLFNARKEVRQTQAGITYRQQLNAKNTVNLTAYVGERQLEQYLAIPRITQTRNAGHAGGVIDFTRNYAGTDAYLQHDFTPNFNLISGVAFDYMQDRRKGYENFLGTQNGVKGNLRRNEKNKVYNLDPYLQTNWTFLDDWTLTGGLRYSTTTFKSKDYYFSNGDDSGRKKYEKWLPSVGISWKGLADTNIYASYSRGFETGTFLEMSYRPDGVAGLNFDLKPLTTDNYEIGIKRILGEGLLTAALFRSNSKDDIISAGTFDGRATYRNAGKTRRQGAELSWKGNLWEDLQMTIAYNYVDARFRETVSDTIRQGNRIAGVAKHNAYASLGWFDKQGWRLGADVRYHGKVQVNNANSESAPSYTVVGTYAGYLWDQVNWAVDTHVRVNNLFNKDYATVVINDSNGRYYEPALKRNFSAGVNIKYKF
ncbi:TonB-dependent receptor family protein [Basfia succiniciproducens]|uniref:TonB-dependent receptor family protein n=1 Tax=Basfia succiniciproducens TaxID=653940 RepID=UPI003FCE637F